MKEGVEKRRRAEREAIAGDVSSRRDARARVVAGLADPCLDFIVPIPSRFLHASPDGQNLERVMPAKVGNFYGRISRKRGINFPRTVLCSRGSRA